MYGVNNNNSKYNLHYMRSTSASHDLALTKTYKEIP